MEAGIKREKRKTAKAGRGRKQKKDGEQDAGERSEISNGCEYIAVINFAKSRRRRRKRRKRKRRRWRRRRGRRGGGGEDTAKVLPLAWSTLQSCRTYFSWNEGGRTEKPRESPDLTISEYHVSGTCLGGHLSSLVQSVTTEQRWGENYP